MIVVDFTEFSYNPAPHIKIKLHQDGHVIACGVCGENSEKIVPQERDTIKELNRVSNNPFIGNHLHAGR